MKSTLSISVLSLFIASASFALDLNKANASELAHSVKGIGEKRAEAIVKYRQTHGAFKSVTELSHVPGLGSNFVKNHSAELQQQFKIN